MVLTSAPTAEKKLRCGMSELNNKEDFKWYKNELDVQQKYEHLHIGEPEKYPCLVRSEFWDDPNGPYTFYHTFIYEKVIVCESCGNSQRVLKEIEVRDD